MSIGITFYFLDLKVVSCGRSCVFIFTYNKTYFYRYANNHNAKKQNIDSKGSTEKSKSKTTQDIPSQ